MTFEELQKCLDVLGVTVEFNLRYPDGKSHNSQTNYEMLLERMDMLETELEGSRVLLADDNDLNREIMKEILINHGILVEESLQ